MLSWKTGIVFSLLKKSTLNPGLDSSYSPIANLSAQAKIVEKSFVQQIHEQMGRKKKTVVGYSPIGLPPMKWNRDGQFAEGS